MQAIGDILKPMVLNKFQKAPKDECRNGLPKAMAILYPEFSLQPFITAPIIDVETFRPLPMQFGIVQMARHPPKVSGVIRLPPFSSMTPIQCFSHHKGISMEVRHGSIRVINI